MFSNAYPSPSTHQWKWVTHIFHKRSIFFLLLQNVLWFFVFVFSRCTSIASGFDVLKPASSCQPSVKFHRMSFNNISPPSLKGKDALITNKYGTVRSYYAFHRVTHSEGWIAILQQGTVNKLEFENADQVTNISYSAIFYEFYVSSLCSKIQYSNLSVQEKSSIFMIDCKF